MDKLRAIEYFNRATETGSFSAAARSFDVSTSAVTQLLASLDRSLGVLLFHRTSRGISLTSDGKRYYRVSRLVAGELQAVEQRLGPSGARPRGMLTVGMRSNVAQGCVLPRIGRFLATFPEIELILKPVESIEQIEAQDIDLAVMTGWPPERDYVVRYLAQTHLVVCASPEYWLREGKPEHPEELARHHCLLLRSSGGALLDRWTFEKNGERRVVDVKGRLLSDVGSWVDVAACAGVGICKLDRHYFTAGKLVPVLTDWQVLEAPLHFAVYRPAQRQSKLVRVFLDFLVEVFAELESECDSASDHLTARVSTPEWYGHAHGRQSDYLTRRRKDAL